VPNSEHRLADVRPVGGVDFTNGVTISWFPDGKRLAVAERDADNRMNGITMIPIDSGEARRLIWTTVQTGVYRYPTVSPNGNELAYALCSPQCDIQVIELTPDFRLNGPARRLTDQKATAFGIAWTPDGRSLVYGFGALTTSSLYRVALAGG